MRAFRIILAALILLGLVAVIYFSLRPEDVSLTVAVTTVAPTTAAPSTVPPTTLAEKSPTTTTPEQRLAEVEEILHDLYFRWFDAIYRGDENALRGVVATQGSYDAGIEAMQRERYPVEPSQDLLSIRVKEILLDRRDCLVVHNELEADFLDEDMSLVVDVLWPYRDGWRLATGWIYPEDLWLEDCDLLAREQIAGP